MYKINAERPRPPFLSNAKYAPLVIFSFVFLTLLSMSCLNNESEAETDRIIMLCHILKMADLADTGCSLDEPI